jgi:hypothetical protein
MYETPIGQNKGGAAEGDELGVTGRREELLGLRPDGVDHSRRSWVPPPTGPNLGGPLTSESNRSHREITTR